MNYNDFSPRPSLSDYEDKINIDLYALIGAKLYGQYDGDVELRFTSVLVQQKLVLAEKIAKEHSSFSPVYEFLRANYDSANIGTDFDELFTVPELVTEVDFAILMAAFGAFLDRGNPDRSTSNSCIIAVERALNRPGAEVVGVAAIGLLCVALWFSDYKGYRERVYEHIKDLVAEGWYSEGKSIDLDEVRRSIDNGRFKKKMKKCRECGTLSPEDTVFCYICGTKFDSVDESDSIDSAINDVNDKEYLLANFDSKYSFVERITREAADIVNYQIADADGEKFIQWYLELTRVTDLDPVIRMRFIVICINVIPTLVFKHRGLITADEINTEIDSYIDTLEPQIRNEFIRLLHKDGDGAVYSRDMAEMMDAMATSKYDGSTNWQIVGEHVEDLAKKFGLADAAEAAANQKQQQPGTQPSVSMAASDIEERITTQDVPSQLKGSLIIEDQIQKKKTPQHTSAIMGKVIALVAIILVVSLVTHNHSGNESKLPEQEGTTNSEDSSTTIPNNQSSDSGAETESENIGAEYSNELRYFTKNTDSTLNLRKLPQHDSELVGTVSDQSLMYFSGEIEKGLGSDGKVHEWYKVKLNNNTVGWARSDLLQEVFDSQDGNYSGNWESSSTTDTVENQSDPAQDAQDVENAVVSYLYAFVRDVNNGSYDELYSAVEPGSKMEESQKKFLQNSDLSEDLINYIIQSSERIDTNTYYTTVVEKYDIINYKDDTRYYLEQRCTYEVKKQYDDTWMVSDFVGSIDVLDKTEY